MDDEKIIELFRERSEQAIVELSDKYGNICKKIAYNIVKNHSDVEECVNDAYLGVWNSIPPQNPSPLSAYVYKIVRNTAIKRYHANTAVKRNSYYDVSLSELEACLPALNSVEDDYILKMLSKKINEFLDNLDTENRVIFVRRYWYADSIADIADRMSMNRHAVTVRLFRIREKLKKFLKKEGYDL